MDALVTQLERFLLQEACDSIRHADGFSASTELIEAFLIRLFDPRLNKRARAAEATLDDASELENVSK
jgi:hypothetical protein